MRARRLQSIAEISPDHASLVLKEIDLCQRRLNYQGTTLSSNKEIKSRWATMLHKSIDGAPLSESSKVRQQHLWITDGSTFLTGGCNSFESTNHILQICHRTNADRICRYNNIVSYIASTYKKEGRTVYTQPHIRTTKELQKPDLTISTNNTAYVIDAQIINDQYKLGTAHDNKARKYKHLTN